MIDMAMILLTYWLMLAGIMVIILVFCVYMVWSMAEQGKKPFGFNCDRCTGKFDKHGRPLLRCKIKPRILAWIRT